MTSDHEPPRLRTLQGELPAELLLALQETSADHATPAELAALVDRVNGTLRDPSSALKQARRSARSPVRRGRVAAVALTFALGAAAGVVGSSAVFFVISSNSAEPRPSAAPPKKSPPARPATATVTAPEASAAPEPAPDGSAAIAVQPATREPVRPPARNSAAEPPSEPSSRFVPGSRDEFALLARAQSALAPNPGLALALASDHERNFPNGALVQERELVAISALLRLGRRTEAVGRAARFHQQFPTSVHGRRIDVLLGGSQTSGSVPH